MDQDKGHMSFDKNGRRLVGLCAKASGPVDQDKNPNYNNNSDREGRMNFIEGKVCPNDPGAKTNSLREDMSHSHKDVPSG